MKKLFILLVLGILGLTIYQKGKRVSIPKTKLTKGKETIQTILEKTESAVYHRLKNSLKRAGFASYPQELLLVALKEERILQVYGKKETKINLIKSYPFTAFSGDLGPKLQEGDKQIPEGIYKITYLNPNSSYHLSLKVNYPNEFDRSKTTFTNKKKMGGDIFIHGKAVTIGCIPIGDLAIEELFVLAQKAMSNTIKIIIAPRDFRVRKEYPIIPAIDWEEELYQMIEEQLVGLED